MKYQDGVMVMRATQSIEVRAVVRGGPDGVSRAAEECVRYLAGCMNVDPASICFEVEHAPRDACTPSR